VDSKEWELRAVRELAAYLRNYSPDYQGQLTETDSNENREKLLAQSRFLSGERLSPLDI
jgi:hypothetical protein